MVNYVLRLERIRLDDKVRRGHIHGKRFPEILPLRPKALIRETAEKPAIILPAGDILDFHYPPESEFKPEMIEIDVEDLLQS